MLHQALQTWPDEPVQDLFTQPFPVPKVPWPETREGFEEAVETKAAVLRQKFELQLPAATGAATRR
jgi:hypothetical protein